MQTSKISVQPGSSANRILALDIFRGITMAAMILVNDPGIETRIYGPLQHAEWNGITPTDYIFPSFIFIVGISIALSITRQLEKGIPKRAILQKIIKRAITLFILGMALSILQKFDLRDLRITGVLQRIAVVYFCCSLLLLYTSRKFQVRLGIFILITYFLVMTLVPVPGYGYAILEPGKNLAAWVDGLLLPGKLYHGNWDPEGILSTFPAIVTGISGLLAGYLLLEKTPPERKINWLFFAGLAAFAIAHVWNWFFPINKNLWTSSFVLYTAGLDAMLLAFLYFLVDILGYTKWAKPFVVFGSNAIAAYLASEIFYDLIYYKIGGESGQSLNDLIIQAILPTGISPELLSLLWALAYVGLCYIPVYWMYTKKIFLKI